MQVSCQNPGAFGTIRPMKTTTFALAFTLFCAAFAQAADPIPQKTVDTSFLKKYAETRRFMLGRPQNPKVAPDGKTVLFLRADADKPTLKLFEFDVAIGQSKEVLSPASLLKGDAENLTPEEKVCPRAAVRLSAGGFADFHFDNTGKNVLLPLSGKLFVFERATGKVLELKTGDGGAVVDPKWSCRTCPRRSPTFAVTTCTCTTSPRTSGESAVTKGGTAIKTHGLAEFVAQEEMGRFTGFWWSPDGKHIAYEEADHTGVETWYVADPFKPDQKPAEQFYPRPGKKNVSVRLGVIPVEGGETVWVEWDHKKHEYLVKVEWQKYGPLTLLLQDRKQQSVDLFEANIQTGQINRLFRLTTQSTPVNGLAWTTSRFTGQKMESRYLLRADDMMVITDTVAMLGRSKRTSGRSSCTWTRSPISTRIPGAGCSKRLRTPTGCTRSS